MQKNIKTPIKQNLVSYQIPQIISTDPICEEIYEVINRTTAIPILDRTLCGGLPSGSVVNLYADPKSMAEVFLYQFTQARKTYYFSCDRHPKYVMRDIKNFGFKTDNITFVDIYSAYYISTHGELVDNIGNEFVDAKIVEFTESNVKKLMLEGDEKRDINIVFDSFSFYLELNVNPGIIKRLLNVIYESTKTLNCLSFLYSIKDSNKNSLINDILKSCDAIFEVDLERTSDKISSSLSIPKVRGKVPTVEMLKFKVGDGVGIQIDTTKDIA